MLKKIDFVLLSGIFLVLLNFAPIFAQGETVTKIKPEESGVATAIGPEVLWLWGDVVAVDAQSKALSVKYFDYETEAEKDIVLSVDDKTTYENVKSLEEIKVKDTVSVDYISDAGKNVAKNISVEKPEAAGEEGVSPKEAVPEEGVSSQPSQAKQKEAPQK